jgi:hypothetical protein
MMSWACSSRVKREREKERKRKREKERELFFFLLGPSRAQAAAAAAAAHTQVSQSVSCLLAEREYTPQQQQQQQCSAVNAPAGEWEQHFSLLLLFKTFARAFFVRLSFRLRPRARRKTAVICKSVSW